MKKTKILIILLAISILICLSLGGLGYYTSTKSTANNNNSNGSKYEITMMYYLNGTEKLTEMPANSNESLYKFDKYVCTNKVTGTWDEENWKFSVQKTADATCKLYFVSAVYNVDLNITNAELDEKSTTAVDSNADGVFQITADEGYTFDSATCANEEEIFWDEETSELTVKTIKSDTSCDVAFKLKEYSVVVTVTNGKGAITTNIQHNQQFSTTVTPTSGYGNPTITCNNTDLGQSITAGTWKNNKYTMGAITANTKCVIEFELINVIPVTYTLTIEIAPAGSATVTSPVTVEDGQTVNVTINPIGNTKIGEVTECGGTFNGNVVTVPNVQKNTTCKVIMVLNE